MANYYVAWDLELDADTPEAAALLAREYLLNPEGIATIFTVVGPNNVRTIVDTEHGVAVILRDEREGKQND